MVAVFKSLFPKVKLTIGWTQLKSKLKFTLNCFVKKSTATDWAWN